MGGWRELKRKICWAALRAERCSPGPAGLQGSSSFGAALSGVPETRRQQRRRAIPDLGLSISGSERAARAGRALRQLEGEKKTERIGKKKKKQQNKTKNLKPKTAGNRYLASSGSSSSRISPAHSYALRHRHPVSLESLGLMQLSPVPKAFFSLRYLCFGIRDDQFCTFSCKAGGKGRFKAVRGAGRDRPRVRCQ